MKGVAGFKERKYGRFWSPTRGSILGEKLRIVVFEQGQTFFDDLQSFPVHNLKIAGWFREQVLQRLRHRVERIEQILHAATGAAHVIGKHQVTLHHSNPCDATVGDTARRSIAFVRKSKK